MGSHAEGVCDGSKKYSFLNRTEHFLLDMYEHMATLSLRPLPHLEKINKNRT